MIKIRIALPNDAKKIAEINIKTWRICYKGMLPEELLKNRDITEERILRIHQEIQSCDKIYIVAEINGEVVGYCYGGNKRDNDYPFKYEIFAIYVLSEFQNQGVGKALFDEFKKIINNTSFYLYALKQNIKAHNFYQKQGGKEQPKYERVIQTKEGIKIEEVLYSFNYTA
ncbi:MAG: GNAT family N-acetyltransferase [Alphaproteobacteria bacterium]|nr:GNAT family N-acetyltransferase [Alphaproteobacteria bacterium]